MIEFMENYCGQHDTIKIIITLNKRGITQPQYSNTTKYFIYIYLYNRVISAHKMMEFTKND